MLTSGTWRPLVWFPIRCLAPPDRGDGGPPASRLSPLLADLALEVGEGALETFVPVDARLPAEQGAGAGDVGPPQPGVVLRQRPVLDRAFTAGQRQDFL